MVRENFSIIVLEYMKEGLFIQKIILISNGSEAVTV